MFEVILSDEEVAMLRRMVNTALGDTRVEVHRTHMTPDFREEVKAEEALLRGLLMKLDNVPHHAA
jgi:hypothetical protein